MGKVTGVYTRQYSEPESPYLIVGLEKWVLGMFGASSIFGHLTNFLVEIFAAAIRRSTVNMHCIINNSVTDKTTQNTDTYLYIIMLGNEAQADCQLPSLILPFSPHLSSELF